MAQQNSGADTSVNKDKLPRLYSKVKFNGTVVDYGCGKWTELTKAKAELDGAEWFGYDPFNQKDDVNTESLETLHNGVDMSVCCNVLNVIDDDDEVKRIITEMVSNSKEAIFQIYDGNKSGVGKVTGPNKYQRNVKRSWYEELIRNMGYEVTKATGDFIYVKGEKINEEGC